MRSGRFAAVVCVTMAVSLVPAVAHAQRTWVSGVGDDANPCSRTAPCKTFAGAISKTPASGEIDALDPGGFGAVTITKSITIDGTAGLAGILASGTNAIVIAAGAGDVVILRNLDLNGLGAGLNAIRVLTAGDVRIENCKIYGWMQRGIDDERSTGHLAVLNTVVSNNSQTGILALPSGAASLTINLDRVQMHSNGNAGLAITNGVQAMVTRSTSSSNVHGFYADSNAVLNVDESFAFGNSGTGINSQTGATIRLSHTTVTGNATGLSAAGGSILSYTPATNQIAGNAAGNGPPTGTIMLQ
jgi:hypothetical protein